MSTLTASHGLTLSDIGLKLIKAYEGFRPVDRILVNGQRVVGYGHRLYDDKPVQLSKVEAEDLLKSDLQAYEDMINENVHAPLTQGQYDALVSFAYNIGPKAFLESDTLRALNNGRPLDAANGLDIWRKSTIDGKTYVVDALMRRRTAEKALFLRTEKTPRPAPAVDLPPVRDEAVALLSTEDALPVFTADDAAGIVAKAPFNAQAPQNRRREDGPAGVLMLSEVVDETQPFEDEAPWVETEIDGQSQDQTVSESVENQTDIKDDNADLSTDVDASRSVIADAAADISERLDALIENVREDETTQTESWPETLIQPSSADTKEDENIIAFPDTREGTKNLASEMIEAPKSEPLLTTSDTILQSKERLDDDLGEASDKPKKVDLVIDDLAADDAMRERADSASRFIEREALAPNVEDDSNLGFWMIMLGGFILLGMSLAASFRGAEALMGQWGPLVVIAGVLIGALMVLGAAYYAIRRAFR